MKSSGIGGQAVMEGVMMKNKDKYAVAIRKPDQTILVERKEYQSFCKIEALRKTPLVRGVINFVDSLILGMSTLTFSASFFDEEEGGEQPAKSEKEEGGEQQPKSEKTEEPDGQDAASNSKNDKLVMGFTVFLSILFAVAIFMVLPYFISLAFQRVIHSQTIIILLEGVLRLLIFILYILLISRMKDIQRVFMYHGAEHKCINCIEHGLELTLDNVKKSSKQHKRCGTSFLFFVVIISIIATMFIRVDSRLLRLVLRLLIIPLVAGISYEIIRLAGSSDNVIVNLLSKPGLWMQNLTTKEPDDEMIEVGIASVEAVFDWRSYIEDGKEGVV